MADLPTSKISEQVRIVGQDATGAETTPVSSKTNGQLDVYDGCNTAAVSGVINLTTTAVEGKIGGSRLTDRKYVEFEALTTNVMWGYTTTCVFNLSKSGFYSLPVGNFPIYFKVSSGTGSIAFAEKS